MNEAYQARQRKAYDAAVKSWESGFPTGDIVKAATKEAVRVRLTNEVFVASDEAYDAEGQHSFALEAAIRAALKAAGFEVEP